MRSIVIAAAAVLCLGSHAAIAQDVAAGEAAFKKCTACHAVGEGAANRMGPQLNGVVGRTAGTASGYSYSAAMTEAGTGGLVWNEESLHAFLKKPRDFVKGTKMAFGGIADDAEISNIIAYLATFPAQ